MKSTAYILAFLFISLFTKEIRCSTNDHEEYSNALNPPSLEKPKCRWLKLQSWLTPNNPKNIYEMGVKFYLSTSHHPSNVIISFTKNNNIQKSKWTRAVLKRKKTIVITHGFQNSANDEWVKNLTTALLAQKEDVNVIAVDWSNGADTWNYYRAVGNTVTVGRAIAKLLHILRTNFYVPLSQVHLVGHSLGAQISAFATHHIGKEGKIGRLTALDPASPCFAEATPDLRISPDDAAFVDVIHTNGKEGHLSSLGMRMPVGHIDFYPNGGREQPGCSKSPLGITRIWKSLWTKVKSYFDVVKVATCSHALACDYFIESITAKNCSFWGHKWGRQKNRPAKLNCSVDYCSPMGIYSNMFPARGIFYVPVIAGRPYCVKDAEAEQYLRKYYRVRG